MRVKFYVRVEDLKCLGILIWQHQDQVHRLQDHRVHQSDMILRPVLTWVDHVVQLPSVIYRARSIHTARLQDIRQPHQHGSVPHPQVV